MCDLFFSFLETAEFYLHKLGVLMIILPGLALSARTRFFQFHVIARLKRCVQDLRECGERETHGVSPLKLYFTSIGGMIGIGNVVSIVTAVSVGGPGSLFWLWIATLLGMLIKYSEIYLGILYREKNTTGCYDGGPMYFLLEAFRRPFLAKGVAFLLCFYAVEVFQFTVVVETLELSFGYNRYLLTGLLMSLIFWTAFGGVKRLADVCSLLMPPFIISYVAMCLWVIGHHSDQLLSILGQVITDAFNGTAAIGGFAGATMMMAAQEGVVRAVYAGDIGIGFDAILQSTTKTKHPERQARLAIFSLVSQGIVCTMTLLTVLCSGLWKDYGTSLLPSEYMPRILGQYVPYIDLYMAILIFLAAFTTIIAYFTVGMRTARYLKGDLGVKIYITYAILAFAIFSQFDQTVSQSLMTICSVLLITINISGMLKLRHKIRYQ